MRTLRVFAGLTAAVALVLTGCGTTEQATSDSPAPAGGPVSVVDARGKTVTLKAPARRVAATEWNGAEDLVSLGVMPVGAADLQGYGQYVHSAPLDGSVKDIGTRSEPSIDALAALGPDLVVVTDSLTGSALDQIEAKVPVLVIPGGDTKDPIGTMFDTINMIAKATGTEDEAAQLKSSFDAKIATGKSEVDKAGAMGEPVAFADAYVTSGNVTIRPYTSGSLVGAVFGQMGLKNAWTVAGDKEYGVAQVDVEGLTQLPDLRFWYLANSAAGDPFAEQLAGNSIWANLPFVKSGRVHRFQDGLWMFGGPKSMEQYVDAAVAALKF